jgi:hypothetical protein
MPASEARILANQQNAKLSTGPRTDEGKASSRGNSYKHGLTGDGVVVSNRDAAKIDQMTAAFMAEFRPTDATGRMLVERMAVQAVRMERSVEQECAAVSENVRQAEANFEAPEGLDETTVAQLRREAGRIALFDPSKEACLARKYEAAAERGFYKALKELRQIEKEQKVADPLPDSTATKSPLGSFLPVETSARPIETKPAPTVPATPSNPPRKVEPGQNPSAGRAFDVPFTIGRAG